MKRIPAAVAALAVLAACQAAGPESESGAAAGDSPPRETNVASSGSDSLRLRLVVPDRVEPGAAVQLAFEVRNTTDRPLDLYLRGRDIAFDVVVTGPDGSVVWRKLEGEVVQAILRLETLPPGESLELEARWDQRTQGGELVGPGDYTVRAELLTENEPLVSPDVPLRIG